MIHSNSQARKDRLVRIMMLQEGLGRTNRLLSFTVILVFDKYMYKV
jgi:hypothetical protein